MKILKRYVLWEMGGPTFLGLVVFTFVLLASHLFKLMDLLINRGVPFPLFAALVGSLLPPLLILTIPMALLVGVLLGVGRLSADNEVMAMRTSGVNLGRIFIPVLIAGAVIMGALTAANATFVPQLVRVNTFLLNQIKFIVTSHVEAGRVIHLESDENDVSLYFRRRNPLSQRMEAITLKVVLRDAQDPARRTNVLVTAAEGYIHADLIDGIMDVRLTRGMMHHLDAETSATESRYVVTAFQSLKWKLVLEKPDAGLKPPALSSWQIMETLRNPGDLTTKKIRALWAELFQRHSIPLACVSFVLLGIPLAIRVRPTGKGVAFAIAFGLIFFYYVMLKWGASLTQDGSSLGAMITFMPNVLIGAAGVVLFYRILRQ